MDKKFTNVLISFVVLLALFAIVMFVLGAGEPAEGALFNFSVDQTSVVSRFVFVVLGTAIAVGVYFATQANKAWEIGTREVAWMAIGAALYAVFSFVFNGTVFVVPSLSQVSLRPAIAIPMFFGFAIGPVVGFFTGAVGNMFGDALTGFGLSPQWSVGNGLVGFVAGLSMLFKNRKQSMNTVLIAGGVLALIFTLMYVFNPTIPNTLFFLPEEGIFGDQPITLFAGMSVVVRFILVLLVRLVFGSNIDVTAAVTWGMLGNLLGIGFAAISDIWINGYSPAVAIVGEFLPAAGPNLIFAAILVPLLVGAYAAVGRQSRR